jgi:TRAP-type mannitol/chloroaromatic compound transport system permease large subunit
VRNRIAVHLDHAQFARALWPYVVLQLVVVAIVLAFPGLIPRS